MPLQFEDLYHAYKNMVFNLALHYCQNTEEAEEITQDVFVSVYQNLANFEEKASPSTWIYRIAINKSLDHLKTKKRKKRFGYFLSLFTGDSDQRNYEPVDLDHPGVLLEDKEALAQLFAQINALPDQQKTALILHKIEHKSQIEVAQIMNISPKAVESLVQRAKQSLIKKI